MKLSLLITGQIRDHRKFEAIADGVIATQSCFDKIVFSSWTDQVSAAREIFSSRGLETGIGFCDSLQVLPLSAVINRDIMSFLAQHQQISFGLGCFDRDSYVIRIRSDAEIRSSGAFAEFINFIRKCWAMPEHQEKTLIVGASFMIPYFFDDRVLMLTPKSAEYIRNIRLELLYSYDYYSMFPEYVIYSNIIEASRPEDLFCRHDHRYRLRERKNRFSDYDFAVFGPTYGTRAIGYVEKVRSNIAFLREAAVKADSAKIFDEFFPIVGFDCVDLSTFENNWMRHIEQYSAQYDVWLQNGHNCEGVTGQSAESQKQTLNFTQSEYARGRYENVLKLSQAGKTSLFKLHYAELEGASLFLLGQIESATELLWRNFSDGHRGVEQMFYLIRGLAAANATARFNLVARTLVSMFANEDRFVDHVCAAAAAHGIKMDFDPDALRAVAMIDMS